MNLLTTLAEAPLYVGLPVLVAAFAALAFFADVFVDRSVGVARRLGVPKIVIGIVLVSLATTVPEASVSVQAALAGHPEMALGNAIGSVICNTGLALAACALLASRPVPVHPRVLHLTGGALLLLSGLTLGFVMTDHVLSRGQGAVLLMVMAAYLAVLLWRRPEGHGEAEGPGPEGLAAPPRSLGRSLGGFVLALAGVLVASRFVLASALGMARALHVPRSVVALSLVALGTSIPEVATSIVAARRGHGEIAVGNILGASILNLGWVAGLSAVVTPLSLTPLEVRFMFPALFAFVLLTLVVLWTHAVLTRREGGWLLSMYGLYLLAMAWVFRAPGG